MLQNHNNRPIIVGQGPAVLAAGSALKLFDFFLGGGGVGGIIFYFSFLHLSVIYNVSFTKICISMPHRLNEFFFAFFHEILFYCIFKKWGEGGGGDTHVLKIKIRAIFF